jgi:hypothetical protein
MHFQLDEVQSGQGGFGAVIANVVTSLDISLQIPES